MLLRLLCARGMTKYVGKIVLRYSNEMLIKLQKLWQKDFQISIFYLVFNFTSTSTPPTW